MRGDRLVERQEPDGRLTLLTVLPVERVEHFLDRFGRAEELIEVWGHRFRERQEPDGGLPLLTVLPVERVEDLLRGFGRAEDRSSKGAASCLSPSFVSASRARYRARAASIAAGASIVASGGGALPSFKAARSSSDCRRRPGSTGFPFGAPS